MFFVFYLLLLLLLYLFFSLCFLTTYYVLCLLLLLLSSLCKSRRFFFPLCFPLYFNTKKNENIFRGLKRLESACLLAFNGGPLFVSLFYEAFKQVFFVFFFFFLFLVLLCLFFSGVCLINVIIILKLCG